MRSEHPSRPPRSDAGSRRSVPPDNLASVRIDLHTHSSCSDGTTTPRELVLAAAREGLDALALTDHDTSAGWAEAVEAAGEVGLELVRGMEISTKVSGSSVHLLAYLPDPTYEPLTRMLSMVVDGRDQRIPRMVDNLRRLDIGITTDMVAAKAEDAAAVGRPHVADVLVDLGRVASREQAFDELLRPGLPGYADRPAPAIDDAIRTVTQAGGVSVLAHPWGRGGGSVLPHEEIARLKQVGLAGIEVDHRDHDDHERAQLRGIARELDLILTGSSDFHGAGKPNRLGECTTAPDQYERLLAAADAASTASGRPVPEVIEAR
jgi:3',5'-nucleoside bisphosphate phosphatase